MHQKWCFLDGQIMPIVLTLSTVFILVFVKLIQSYNTNRWERTKINENFSEMDRVITGCT